MPTDMEQFKQVVSSDLYTFLKYNATDILGLLYDQEISVGKAVEALAERQLGIFSHLPAIKDPERIGQGNPAGAAVSASTQPMCPKCQSGMGGAVYAIGEDCESTTHYEATCTGKEPHTIKIPYEFALDDFAQFFAAAPAQERWYTKAELHDALIARNYEPKIADELAGWIADQLELAYKKGKERAQEQPVEPK